MHVANKHKSTEERLPHDPKALDSGRYVKTLKLLLVKDNRSNP